ncbi:hypothetical protein IG631_10831 [Alternaria alternata]|nr:hypothetical protein IG631_10831 [Alternaria alternata]
MVLEETFPHLSRHPFTKRPACVSPGTAVPNFRQLPPAISASIPTLISIHWHSSCDATVCAILSRSARSILSFVLYMFTINAMHDMRDLPFWSLSSPHVPRAGTLTGPWVSGLQVVHAKGVSISSRHLSAHSERNGKRALFPTREYSSRNSVVWS